MGRDRGRGGGRNTQAAVPWGWCPCCLSSASGQSPAGLGGLLSPRRGEDRKDLCSRCTVVGGRGRNSGRVGEGLPQVSEQSGAGAYTSALDSESCVPPLSCFPYGKRPQPHSAGAASLPLLGVCNVCIRVHAHVRRHFLFSGSLPPDPICFMTPGEQSH